MGCWGACLPAVGTGLLRGSASLPSFGPLRAAPIPCASCPPSALRTRTVSPSPRPFPSIRPTNAPPQTLGNCGKYKIFTIFHGMQCGRRRIITNICPVTNVQHPKTPRTMQAATVHLSINLKSHRAGLVNDLMSHRRPGQTVNFRTLHSAQEPHGHYPSPYHAHSFNGKRHSRYPKF